MSGRCHIDHRVNEMPSLIKKKKSSLFHFIDFQMSLECQCQGRCTTRQYPRSIIGAPYLNQCIKNLNISILCKHIIVYGMRILKKKTYLDCWWGGGHTPPLDVCCFERSRRHTSIRLLFLLPFIKTSNIILIYALQF